MTPWTRGYEAGTEDTARSRAFREAGRPGRFVSTNCPYDSGPGFGPWISGYTAGWLDAGRAASARALRLAEEAEAKSDRRAA